MVRANGNLGTLRVPTHFAEVVVSELISQAPDASALYALEGQIGLIRDRTRMVAMRMISSCYIYGSPGIGKTHWVRTTLEDMKVQYEMATGNMTAQGLFELLKRCSDTTIVFDDVTAVFQNKIARSILLAALGNDGGRDGAREVSYHIGRRQQTIQFTGGIIATSNMLSYGDATFAALNSRTKPLQWTPTTSQIEAMMRWTASRGWRDEVSPADAAMVAEIVIQECRRLNVAPEMRLLYEHALPCFLAQRIGMLESSWQAHLTSSISGQVRIDPAAKVMTRRESSELNESIAGRLLAKHGTAPAAADEWFAETNQSLRTLQRYKSKLKIAQ
jgi:hypothetical protein